MLRAASQTRSSECGRSIGFLSDAPYGASDKQHYPIRASTEQVSNHIAGIRYRAPFYERSQKLPYKSRTQAEQKNVSDAAQSFTRCSQQDIRIGQKSNRSHHVIEIADQKLSENAPGILFQDQIVEEIQCRCNEKQYKICRIFSDTLSEILHTLPHKAKKAILCCLFRKVKNVILCCLLRKAKHDILCYLFRKAKNDILCYLFRKAKNDALNRHHSGQTS